MLSLKPRAVSENDAPIPQDGGSRSNSKSCVKRSAQQMCSKSVSSAKKIQVRIVRDSPRSVPSAGPRRRRRLGDGSLIRVTVDVGRINVRLKRGDKHHYEMLGEESNPAPLRFPADAAKRLVPEDECRIHYIHFSKKGSVVSKTWVCGICGKVCPKQGALMQHLLIDHLNVRSFTCGQCSKSFKTKMVLDQHVKSLHSNLKPYVCAVCQKRFGRVSVLIQHRRLHSDELQFVCHCGKAFHQKGNLTVHQQRVHRPSADGRVRQTSLVYNCLACSAELPSVQLLLDHKRTCRPLLESLGNSIKVNPDTERRLDAGRKRNINDKLLSKIQSIVQQQERLRRRQGAAQRPSDALPDPDQLRRRQGAAQRPSDALPDPDQLQRQLMVAIGMSDPTTAPQRSAADRRAQKAATQPRQSQQLEPASQQQQQPAPQRHQQLADSQQQQQQQLAPPEQQQQQLAAPRQLPPPTSQQQLPPASQQHQQLAAPQQQQQPPPSSQQHQPSQTPAGKMMGVLTAPIRTRSMQLAREKNLQPFVLLQSDGEEPTLAKVLRTSDSLELLVPATTADLRQLRLQQTGHADGGKVDLPVVAIVTHFYDASGTPHVRVQPPTSERPGCTALSTSQVDLGPTQGGRPLAVAAASAAAAGSGRQPSSSPAGPRTAAVPERGLSMPSGADLLAPASQEPLPTHRAPTTPADRSPAAETLMLAGAANALAAGTDVLTAGTDVLTAGTNVLVAGTSVLAADTNALPAGANHLPAGINALSAGGDTMVQFVRQTAAGDLEPVSVADAALLFSQPGTSYQILPGAGTVTEAVVTGAGRPAPAGGHPQ